MDLLRLQYCHHLQCILGTKVYTVIASYEGIQDTFRFWIPRCGFQNLFQWKLVSGFQSFDLYFRFQSSEFQIQKQKLPEFWIP